MSPILYCWKSTIGLCFFYNIENVHRYIQDTVSLGMAGWILRTKWSRSNSKSMPHSQQIYTIVTRLLAKLIRVCDGMRRLASVTSLFKQLWKHRQHSNWQHVMSSGKVEWVCVCVCIVSMSNISIQTHFVGTTDGVGASLLVRTVWLHTIAAYYGNAWT